MPLKIVTLITVIALSLTKISSMEAEKKDAEQTNSQKQEEQNTFFPPNAGTGSYLYLGSFDNLSNHKIQLKFNLGYICASERGMYSTSYHFGEEYSINLDRALRHVYLKFTDKRINLMKNLLSGSDFDVNFKKFRNFSGTNTHFIPVQFSQKISSEEETYQNFSITYNNGNGEATEKQTYSYEINNIKLKPVIYTKKSFMHLNDHKLSKKSLSTEIMHGIGNRYLLKEWKNGDHQPEAASHILTAEEIEKIKKYTGVRVFVCYKDYGIMGGFLSFDDVKYLLMEDPTSAFYCLPRDLILQLASTQIPRLNHPECFSMHGGPFIS